MIPEHLKGKSAAKIVDEERKRFDKQSIVTYLTADQRIRYLENLLLLAVKDALCNADGKNLCGNDYGLMGSEAEGRAIVFLNMVLPKEQI